MTQATENPIADFISSVHLGPSQNHKQLTLWPLIRTRVASGIPYICLGEAFDSGAAQIDEINGGSVPHVALVNRGSVSVLVLFGEEIVGAKQNRVANASFLVAPKSRVVLDVSCVEQGRWSPRPSASFSTGEQVLSSSLRRGMARRVSRSRSAGRGFDANQAAVWDGVSKRVEGMRSPSKTGAYRDYARSLGADLQEMARYFQPIEGQVGFVAVRGDRVDGVEAVGDPAVYAAVHDRLLRAYTIDAIDGTHAESAPGQGVEFLAPEDFLRTIASSAFERSPSLGQGTDLRLSGEAVGGCALECGEIVHLMAFSNSTHTVRSGNGELRRGRATGNSSGRIFSRRWWCGQ
ncbi:MAG: hypothetical protein JRE38_12875 [Deltaproteobacteria bacterium]|nr:hypothetical protein [Deltaproteobacteria bacterium]MBW2693173.1 hypothetical protein [Deltaproteobacteria bacterium]